MGVFLCTANGENREWKIEAAGHDIIFNFLFSPFALL